MNDDERLVRLVQRGDQQAFVDLIERHQLAIFGLCYGMMGNVADAEDLTQETFLRFYSSIKRFRPANPLRPWLNKIAANATLDVLRKRRIPTTPIPETEDGFVWQLPDDHPTPEDRFLAVEKRELVRRAIEHIPAEFRVALVLFYLEGLSYHEIAETLGVPESTVETRLFRARKAVSKLLKGRLEDKEVSRDEMYLV